MSEQNEMAGTSPDLFSMLGNILGSMPHDTGESGAETTQKNAESTQKSNGGDILGALLSNPELLSKLPQMLSLVKPLIDGMQPRESGSSVQNQQSVPAMSGKPTSSQKPCDQRSALLYAMKPYLKQDRQEAIDYIVKLSKLGDILKSL